MFITTYVYISNGHSKDDNSTRRSCKGCGGRRSRGMDGSTHNYNTWDDRSIPIDNHKQPLLRALLLIEPWQWSSSNLEGDLFALTYHSSRNIAQTSSLLKSNADVSPFSFVSITSTSLCRLKLVLISLTHQMNMEADIRATTFPFISTK